MRRLFAALGLALALAILLPQVSSAQETTSSLRIIHALPDGPNVDLYIDEVQVAANVPYFTLSDHLAVLSGSHRLQVVQAGLPLEQALIDQTFVFESNDAAIIAITGSVSAPQVLLLGDSVKDAPAAKARVRIIHLAEAAPVDVRVADGGYLLTDQYFGSDDYVDVVPGNYVFDLLQAGTDSTVARTQELRFEQGWNYTLVVTGFADRNPYISVQAAVDRMPQ